MIILRKVPWNFRVNLSLPVVNYLQYRIMHGEKRVVVTGLGVISPVGCNVNAAWDTIIKGESGVVKLGDDYKHLPCRVAAVVNNLLFDQINYLSEPDKKTMSRSTQFALVAAKEALDDAKWAPNLESQKERTGVAVGSSMMDITDITTTFSQYQKDPRQISPYFIPRILLNMTAGQISIKYGFRGPNHSVSTACATGVHAIGDGFRFIKNGDADVMVCGSSEACITPFTIAAFSRIKALSTKHNDQPHLASRPFDVDRDGFVMGEGAAILVLEELEHALIRKAKIYAEILGYGLSGDASHITNPRNDATGAMLAMQRAVDEAGIDLLSISYINAHATSTQVGDAVEAKAIQQLFGDRSWELFVSSTKGAHGHLLGAAGSLETVFAVKAISDGFIPPTLNIQQRRSEMYLNFIPLPETEYYSMRKRVLKNACGFGGTNACLCLGLYLPDDE